MIRQLVAVLLVAGFVVGFVPVHATGTYQPSTPQLLIQTTTLTGLFGFGVANGPAFSHCSMGATACALGQGFVWTNPNGMIGPVILDHVTVQVAQVVGVPSGTMVAGLFAADANGIPTSTTALATSAALSMAAAWPASISPITYTFSGGNQVGLTPGLNYAVVLESMNTTNWGGMSGAWSGTGSDCSGGSAFDPSQYEIGWLDFGAGCANVQVWGDPPTVQGTVSQGSYLYSTMFSFFAVIITLGLIFNRDQPIVKRYGAKAIVVLGLMLAVMWIVGLVING